MARIAYFVHGRGRGHATRSRTAISELRGAGHEVLVFAGGMAEATFRADFQFRKIPVTRARLSAVLGLPFRILGLARLLRGVHVVVSDGDLLGLLAATFYRIPAVSVGHGLTFATCEMPSTARPAWVESEKRKAKWHLLLSQRSVAVHFQKLRVLVATTRLARPDHPGEVAASVDAPLPTGGYLLAYFQGVDGRAHVSALANQGATVVVFSDEPAHYSDNAVVMPLNLETFQVALSRAQGVVGSSGSNVMTECIFRRKPMLALYREDDPEQALNASLASAEGLVLPRPVGHQASEDCATFLEMIRDGRFAEIELTELLPPSSVVVRETVEELL